MSRDTLGRVAATAHDARAAADLHGVALGTPIYAQDGILPVEHLVPGDRIITRDAGLVTLRALDVCAAVLPRVRVFAGSFGRERPARDLILPAAQRMLLRDGSAQAVIDRPQGLVALSGLVDGQAVEALGSGPIRLFTLVFDRPHLFYADGLELASAAPAVEHA
jgi:hypothetical protein